MAGRSVDVSLRIKAQDEASKALDAVGKALKDLAGAQTALSGNSAGVSQFVEKLATNVDSLSALFKKLDTALAQANRSYEANAKQISAVNDSIVERKRRIEELARTEAELQRIQGNYKNISASRQASFIGPVPPRLSSVQRDLNAERGALGKEEANLERLITRTAEARTAALNLRSVQGEVANALDATTNAFVRQSNALDQLTAAERRAVDAARERQRASAVRETINQNTGVNNTGTPASLRNIRQRELEQTFAPIIEREIALQEKVTAELKRQNDELRRKADLASRATLNTINQNTGVNNTGTAGSLRAIRQRELEDTFAPIFRAQDNQLAERAQKSAAAFAELQRYARDVKESLDPVARSTRLVAEEQERLAAAVRAGQLTQNQANAALLQYRGNVDGTAAATARQAREAKELQTYINELRRDFDRAGYAERFLTQETEKLNRALRANIISAEEYQRALQAVTRKSEQLGVQSNPSLFGLNPYQTQNLLFQFNDIATQLASGTSLTQTLAQQGGQILQLFPKVGNAIVGAFRAAAPAIAAVVAVVGTFIIGINEAINAASRLRTLNALFNSTADGANNSATQFLASAKAMREFGVAIDDAMKVARVAIKNGLDTTDLTNFGLQAKGLSVILGTDVPTSAIRLAEALTGGYDALVELDKQTNIFTSSQLENIRTLIAQGDSLGAATLAAEIYSEKLSDIARDSEGPWQRSINQLLSAWNDLKTSLADSVPVQLAIQALTGLARVATAVADVFTTTTDNLEKYRENSARIQELVTVGRGGGWFGGPLRDRATAGPDGFYVARPGMNDPQTQRDIREVNELLKENRGLTEQINKANRVAAEIETEASRKRAQAIERETDALRSQYATVTTEGEKAAQLERDRARLRVEANERFNIGVNSGPTERAAAEEFVNVRLEQLEKRYTDQIKRSTEARQRSREEAQREAEQIEKQTNSLQFQAAAMLRNLEGFRSRAYYDVNAYRVGYGSDTVTRADGRVERVRSNTTITRADAERDLARRIDEFTNVVKQQIGSERFGQFSAQQQAALVSIAYNYGELPNRILGAVRTGTQAEIGAAVRGLRNDNGGVNASRRDREAALLEAPNLAVDQGAAQVVEDTKKKLDDYNDSLDQKLAREARSIENQKALVGLQGEALRAEIERQRIAEETERATEDLRRATDNPTAELTAQQRDQIAVNVRARLKLDEPAKVYADLQKQLDEIQGFRGLLEQRLQTAQQTGDVTAVTQLQQQIEETDRRIATAASNLADFLNTPGNPEALGLFGQELDNLLYKLDQLKNVTVEWKLTLGSATITAQQFANTFTNSAVNALDGFAQAVANGKNVIGSLWTAFRQFAADFLLQIARMIQQQIIFNLVSGFLKGLGPSAGGFGGGIPTGTGGIGGGPGFPTFHTGGIVGGASAFRNVSPAVFANAQRYHSGGIIGLQPGEVPAVLMRGEEVLTRDDPRHMMNGGGAGNVKIVNAFDEGEVISKAMETKAGERAILNLVRRNPRAFQTAMNGG